MQAIRTQSARAIKLFRATLKGIGFVLEIYTLYYQSYCVGKLVYVSLIL